LSKGASRAQAFVDYLKALVANKDRGAIATLRRGLRKAPGTVPQMDRHVLRFLSADSGIEQEGHYYVVASLFAFWHQGRDSPVIAEGNLGRSLRALVDLEENPNTRDSIEQRIEKRLVACLNCHRDDLPEHLRQIVSLLKSSDVPIDWTQLISDIRYWERDDWRVQKAWARGFWIGSRKREEDEAAHTESPHN